MKRRQISIYPRENQDPYCTISKPNAYKSRETKRNKEKAFPVLRPKSADCQGFWQGVRNLFP